MRSSHARASSGGFTYREKPRLLHLFVGILSSAFSCVVILLYFRQLLIDGVSQLLWIGGVSTFRADNSEVSRLVVTLLDGSNLNLDFTSQRSGVVSVTIFSLLFLFLMFPLKGSIWRKLIWLELGFVTGLTWSFIRISTAVMIAYNLGAGAFPIAEFILGPFTDFLWAASLWSVGLSTLVSTGRKR